MEYSQLLKDYLDDAGELVGAFDSALLILEDGPEGGGDMKEALASALGALHTLKGNSGMMGYGTLKDFVHHLEEVLKQMLEGRLEAQAGLPPLLEGSNVIKKALQDIQKSPSSSPQLGKSILDIKSVLANGNPQQGKKEAVAPETYLGARTDTVKVSFRKLDDLLSLVGELVITKTRLGIIEAALKESGDREKSAILKEVLESAGKTITGLQEGIMRARMVPVSTLFRKFTRMARDLARSQDKETHIVFQGEETELDKTVIDELAEPLLHLVRNAIDHGIETPGEREARGKTREGRLTLSSYQESNYIFIRVEDDGRGIDPEEVKKKAIEKGLIKEENLPQCSSISDTLELLFLPGFSTRENSTDISGRGIGLSVVAKNITRLGGQVSLCSRKGEGSSFLIKLPLSLAIIPALMAEVAGELLAIPVSGVEESVRVEEAEIHVMNLREVVCLREKVIPVIRLEEYFSLGSGDKRNPAEKSALGRPKRLYLVIVGKGEKRIALAVDRLKGQQEIVIKPLDDSFGHIKGISGASILGDGRIVLILDIPGLILPAEHNFREGLAALPSSAVL
jgi:two-component system chemotaxis sensor kinase CheA